MSRATEQCGLKGMPKSVSTEIQLTNVMNLVAASAEEKQYTALNGFDSAIRAGAKLLLFSTYMSEESRKIGSRTVKSQFFYALDLVRNRIEKPTRSALTGGTGYTQCPDCGDWKLSDDGKWYFLQPKEKDPALKHRISWGIKRVMPGIFERKGDKIFLPKCIILEITKITWVSGKAPLDASSPEVSLALQDTSFLPNSVKCWEGTVHYPTREEIDAALEAYQQAHPKDPLAEDAKERLCK